MWVSWNRVTTTSPRPARASGASAGAGTGGVVAAVAGAVAPRGAVGWSGGDGRVQAVSTTAIPMVRRSRAPCVRVARIVRLHTSAPIWLRALPPLHRQAPTGSQAECGGLPRRAIWAPTGWWRDGGARPPADADGALRRDPLRRARAAERPLDQHILDLFPAALVTDLDP